MMFIIGKGGFGREVEAYVMMSHGFGVKWVDDFDLSADYKVADAPLREGDSIIAIGDPHKREQMYYRLKGLGAQMPGFVSKYAAFLPDQYPPGPGYAGSGLIVCPYSMVMPNARVGLGVHINVHCMVAHDTEIGDFTTLSPNVMVMGNVRLGRRVFVGTSATFKPGVTVGDDAIIGAGAVVICDIPAGATVVGNPAKVRV